MIIVGGLCRFGGERDVMMGLAQVLREGSCPNLEVLRVLRYSTYYPEFEQAVKDRTKTFGGGGIKPLFID